MLHSAVFNHQDKKLYYKANIYRNHTNHEMRRRLHKSLQSKQELQPPNVPLSLPQIELTELKKYISAEISD